MSEKPRPEGAPREGDRIAKLLARAGVASRREVERMIADRRIAIGGLIVETPATILKDLAGVTVDGKLVAATEPTRMFAFHKPARHITAESDTKGRAPIYTAIRKAHGRERVRPCVSIQGGPRS